MVAAVVECDEGITGDVVCHPDASIAQDAALAVEEHHIGDRYWFLERSLGLNESTLAWSGGHRLILKRAFATLVAHGTVKWVIDEKELEDSLLRLLDDIGFGVDHHPVVHDHGARRDELLSAWAFNLDQAHTAFANGFELVVMTEPRDVIADLFCGGDQSLSGSDGVTDAVDGDLHG